MPMISLCNPSELEELLKREVHQRPSLLLIRSDGCPPCARLHPLIEKLANRCQDFDFYEFNVDHCGDPQQDAELTQLCQRWGVHYLPSQVFLATGKPAAVTLEQNVEAIEDRLHKLLRPA